jgi:hypothetical protein
MLVTLSKIKEGSYSILSEVIPMDLRFNDLCAIFTDKDVSLIIKFFREKPDGLLSISIVGALI